MRKHLWCLTLLLLLTFCAQAQDVLGDWQGTLHAGDQKLRLALHITTSKTGALTATIDSPDQGVEAILATKISFANDQLTVVWDSIRASYKATLGSGGSTLDGTWSQGSSTIPLTFARTPKQDRGARK